MSYEALHWWSIYKALSLAPVPKHLMSTAQGLGPIQRISFNYFRNSQEE